MQNENKRVLSNFFQLLKLVVLLVSYFPTLLLWSISWSSIFSSPLSSPLNFIPLLFVDLLCGDILQRVRERVDSSQNYANTRWSSFKPFSLFFLLRKHTSLSRCSDRLQFHKAHKPFVSRSHVSKCVRNTPVFLSVLSSKQAQHKTKHLNMYAIHAFVQNTFKNGCERMQRSTCQLH